MAILILTAATVQSLTAQRVRLRSQSVPPCTAIPGASNPNWKFADLYGDGNIAVLGSYYCRGGFIYDISDPDAPVFASWYNPGNNQQFLEAIVVGNRAYFGSGNGGGVHIVDVTSPYNPIALGTVDATHGNGHNSIHEMMIVPQGDATYLIENYNSTGVKSIRIIDITNPAAPVFKWEFNPTDVTWVHAFHIRGNKMYTSGWGGKVEIYDIANLATKTPTLLGAIIGGTTNHSTWTSEDGRYLYSCRETYDGDLRVYDVQDPAAPMLIRSIKAGDLGLNAVSPHNPVVMGSYLYVSWYQAGIQVFDISDPTSPKRIGQYDTFAPTFAPTEAQIQALQTQGPWDAICGSPNGFAASSLPSSFDGNWAVYPFLGQNKILAGDLTNGLLILDASAVAAPQRNTVSDYDGDRKTDLSTYSPSTGTWLSEQSSNAFATTNQFGTLGDVIVTGDFDGDGKSDIAVFRPSTGVWYFMNSMGGFAVAHFGVNGDVPVPADFDADGKTDIAVWRPSTGVWYIQQSTLGFKAVQWGTAGDKPLTGDYEGDGKPDITVWRPSNGVWYSLQSSSSIATYNAFGTNGDEPLVGDFDGNGTSDFAVYRPSTGTWYLLDPITRSFSSYRFGIAEDIPVPADYDGDGRTDIAVFRPSQNTWFRLNSSDGSFFARVFGQSGDIPAPASIQP
ncbi:MAG: FG-GAP-like repeat-containing protein [Acidobacteriota bacterium]